MNTNIKLTADSSQAVKAVQLLGNSWTEANSKIEVFKKGLSSASGIVSKFVQLGSHVDTTNDAIAGLGVAGEAKFQYLKSVTGDTVNQLELVRQAVKLQADELNLSLKDVGDAYKFAIYQGRAVGLSAEEAVKSITEVLIKGTGEGLTKFGIPFLEEGLKKTDIIKKTMEMIRADMKANQDQYILSPASIEEQTAKMKNTLTEMVRNFDMFSKGFDMFKNVVGGVADKLKRSQADLWRDVEKSSQLGLGRIYSNIKKYSKLLDDAQQAGDLSTAGLWQTRLEEQGKLLKKFQGDYLTMMDQLAPEEKRTSGQIENWNIQIKEISDQLIRANGPAERFAMFFEKLTQPENNKGLEETREQLKKVSEEINQAETDLKNAQEILSGELKNDRNREETLRQAREARKTAEADLNKLYQERNNLTQAERIYAQDIFKNAWEYKAVINQNVRDLQARLDKAVLENTEKQKYIGLLGFEKNQDDDLRKIKGETLKILQAQIIYYKQINDLKKVGLLTEALKKVDETASLKDLKTVMDQLAGGTPAKTATADPLASKRKELQEQIQVNEGILSQISKIRNQEAEDEREKLREKLDLLKEELGVLTRDRRNYAQWVIQNKINAEAEAKVKEIEKANFEALKKLREDEIKKDKEDSELSEKYRETEKKQREEITQEIEKQAEIKKSWIEADEKLYQLKGQNFGLDLQIHNLTLQANDAKRMGEIEEYNRLQKKMTALQQYKALITEGKALANAMLTTTVKGIMMEDSELRKLGKSRKAYILEELKTLLWSKAMEYGVKAIGTAAEATAMLFFSPDKSLTLYKAAAMYAGAATLAGVSSKAINVPSSSASKAKSADVSKTSLTATTSGKSEVYNIYIGRGVVYGSKEEVAIEINGSLQALKKRGKV